MTSEERDELNRRKKLQRSHRWVEDEPEQLAWAPLTLGLSGCSKRSREAAPALEEKADNREGGTGTRAKGEEGSMGNPNARESNRRYAVAGPKDNDAPAAAPQAAEPEAERSAALREAQEFGMIGLLNTGSGGDPNAPTAPWGRDDSLGTDSLSARGSLEGDQKAAAFGASGLALSGIGDGGGGRGEGVGLGAIGTMGHGAGTGTGQGFGSGSGRLGGTHRASPPAVRIGATDLGAGGGLPTEVVQRIVRQNYGRFRLCYEAGLRNNPNLQGRVTVKFIIDRAGAVSSVTNSGSDLPDPAVVQCVIRAYSGLSFPAPDSGQNMTVVIPITFVPVGGATDDAPAAPVQVRPASVRVVVAIDGLPHIPVGCAGGAASSFEERVTLWRERLSKVIGQPAGVAAQYSRAISGCEAPTWRERTRLLSMMLDALPTVAGRVQLWRMFSRNASVADVLYRDMLARVHTAADMRELHKALGLKFIDKATLDKLMREARTPGERVLKLRKLQLTWADDLSLALKLIEALEDAGDDSGAREEARKLRSRPDIDAHVRTELGELYLRLARRAENKEQAAVDEAEARRAFGEIVEFSPDEPVARRRLGDLLRAHGWHQEARRQYETLARLAPDDASVQLLIAATSEGLGKLEEAVRWAEKASEAGAPGGGTGMSGTSRAMASLFLAWGRDAALKENKLDEVKALRTRAGRLLDKEESKGAVRALLSWSHPELHPTLWSDARGTMMPAPDGDVLMGISQVNLPAPKGRIEVRMEADDAEHAARLGAEAVLTVIFREGEDDEKIVRLPVQFARGGPSTLRFTVADKEVQP
jgi:tetratricopeptide (TPR) repeat protein